VEDCDTIHSIKNKILKKHKIPHDQQDIIFSNKKLDDAYNIINNTKLKMKLIILFNINLEFIYYDIFFIILL
jgi:phosphatidylinositol kinase/protein kinase (PI-3  family)